MSVMSDKYKFFFVHIEKNAGTSICSMFKKLDKVEYLKDFKFRGTKVYGSVRATDYIDYFGDHKWDEYFSFCFVRNPWDRMVSWFSYLQRHKNPPKNFKKWLKEYNFKGNEIQTNYFMTDKNKILVDFVGKFENLKNDFDKVLEKIGLSNDKKLTIENTSKHKPYVEYYDDESKNIIKSRCFKEIEMFNYRFD